MKKLLFLFLFFLGIENVIATDNLQFYYTSEKVENMWITRIGSDEKKSANPYILRRKSDKAFVYCIEPFQMLNQKEDYTSYDFNQANLEISDEDWERISLLAYFGYMYPGHEDKKWYGITQFLIWQTVAKDSTFYFSKEKNGEKEDLYREEIEEIEKYISDYQTLKDLDQGVLILKNQEEWKEFVSVNSLLVNRKESRSGDFLVSIPRNSSLFGIDTFYYREDGQNLYQPGELNRVEISFQVDYLRGTIHLKKKNLENTFISQNNQLSNAIYGIYQQDSLVETIVTDEEGEAVSSALEYGDYVIKEISASQGYLVDEEKYSITIDEENVFLEVYEEQETKKITIQKWYGSGTYQVEEGASFEIYQEDTLVLTIETDAEGLATMTLPFGDYCIHQVIGKEGYQKIEDMSFTVSSTSLDNYSLYNKEIIHNVPNTGIKNPLLSIKLFSFLRRFLYVL